MAKCVLTVADKEAKKVLGTEQLCRGVGVGIKGGIHVMQLLWKQHAHDEYGVFLIIDARNKFNEGNRTKMLWAV